MLVINNQGAEPYIGLIEDYTLPVLQDTPTDNVFELYDAGPYTVFVVARDGSVAFFHHEAFPIEDHDALAAELRTLR